jgi:non-homologous end joining protein Ku
MPIGLWTNRSTLWGRKSDKFFADLESVKYDPQLVELASELIERNSAPFQPKRFKDTYAEELRKLVEKKAKGQKIEIPKTEKAAPRELRVTALLRTQVIIIDHWS